MRHVMLDLETMGTKPNAPVITIAAVMFNPKTRETGEKFVTGVSLKDSVTSGAVIEADTVQWWMAQSEEARQVMLYSQKYASDQAAAITMFEFWLNLQQPDYTQLRIWGNGAGFDNVLLEQMYARCTRTPAWKFYQNRCYRTLRNMASKAAAGVPFEGARHNPVHDATYQIHVLFEVMNQLNLHDLD